MHLKISQCISRHLKISQGKIFMVNTTANWRAQTKTAAALVAQGKLGQIQHVQCHMGSPLMMLFDGARCGCLLPIIVFAAAQMLARLALIARGPMIKVAFHLNCGRSRAAHLDGTGGRR